MKKGFTLIELLVVIAIIAILAAILFPVFAQAKLAAKKTNNLSEMKQLALANVMYSGDFDDTYLVFPYAGQYSSPPYVNGEMGLHWADRLMPYVKNRAIFSDPSDTDTLYEAAGYWLPGATSATDTNTNHFYRVTLTYNDYISHGDEVPTNPKTATQTSVTQPANTVMLGPSDNWFNWNTCQPNSSGGYQMEWDVSTGGWGYEMWGGPQGGYNAGDNFAFADGHAKYSRLVLGGDAVQGASGTLYVAHYVQGVTRPDLPTPGQCPGDYSSYTLGY